MFDLNALSQHDLAQLGVSLARNPQKLEAVLSAAVIELGKGGSDRLARVNFIRMIETHLIDVVKMLRLLVLGRITDVGVKTDQYLAGCGDNREEVQRQWE